MMTHMTAVHIRAGAALGAGAGTAVLAGAVIMLVAVLAAPGPWIHGYVSEAGTAGQPLAITYRWGLSLLAVGVALLGPALVRRTRSSPAPDGSAGPCRQFLGQPFVGRQDPGRQDPDRHFLDRHFLRSARLAAALLIGSAVFAGTSAAIPCSNQCPLPPFEPTTPADVVHTAASIVGMVLLAAAMVAVALADLRRAQRRLAVVAAAGTVPVGATLGLTMLFVGRGPVGAGLERLLLVIAVSWLIGTSLLTVLRNSVKVEPWNHSKTGSPRSSSNSPP
jgi:hypothetical protein